MVDAENGASDSMQHGDGNEKDTCASDAPIEAASETREREVTEKQNKALTDERHFVVGIGASAGGLEALEELVKNVAHINAAIVVVQHLSPHHASVLTQLLARNSKIEIVTATDGTVLEANRIYVIPPNADLSVFHGILHITTPDSTPHFAIDYFLRSLAEDQGPYAIGVILSGTGTDGTFGLMAIKAAGGITFVQEPSSARYDGMPRRGLP
jgi:two-component system CheB/CheR fusion protein